MTTIAETLCLWHQLPLALRERDQWVLWRGERRQDKVTKIPYQRDGRRASSTDPATWSPFWPCLQTLDHGGFDGLGYVFSPDDPFVGVDLDHCLNSDSGVIEAWARKIVADLCSYTEISPSGRGLHILVRGTLPPGGRKKGPLEMYGEGRYYTMTGHHLPACPFTVEERAAELAALHAATFPPAPLGPPRRPVFEPRLGPAADSLLPGIFAARNGEKMRALWNGSDLDYPSKSEADMALVCGMTYRSMDPAVLERWMRGSGRLRDRWDEPRGDTTLLRYTITKAIDYVGQHGIGALP